MHNSDPSSSRLTPEQKQAIRAKVDAGFARVIGFVAALIGVGGVALAAWGVYKVYALEQRTPGLVLVGILLVIGAFFLQVGLRLMLDRPNRYGSILGPLGWRILGALFAVTCAGMLAFVVATQTLDWETIFSTAVPVIGAGVFSYLCFYSAKRASANAGSDTS